MFRSDIIKGQHKSKADRPQNHSTVSGIIMDSQNRVWIPEDDAELKLRILIAAHCGMAGHRAKTNTVSAVSKEYYWKTLDIDTQSFCDSCIHCLCTDSKQRIPRPLGNALHGEKPNEVDPQG